MEARCLVDFALAPLVVLLTCSLALFAFAPFRGVAVRINLILPDTNYFLLKLYFETQRKLSANCSIELAPTMTEVTPSCSNTQRSAYCAKLTP